MLWIALAIVVLGLVVLAGLLLDVYGHLKRLNLALDAVRFHDEPKVRRLLELMPADLYRAKAADAEAGGSTQANQSD